MYYTEIIFSIIATIAAFTIFLINIINRFKFNMNRLIAIISFLITLQFSIHLLLLFNIQIIPISIAGKIFFFINILIAQLAFHVAQIYPDGRVDLRWRSMLLAAIPGIVTSTLALTTDLYLYSVSFDQFITYNYGKYIIIYISIIMLYLSGVLILLLYKSNKIENRPLKREILYTLQGLAFGFLLLFIALYIFPFFLDIHSFLNIGMSIPIILVLIIVNYAVYDIRKTDFKKFYQRIFFWISLIILLFIPIFFALKYSMHFIKNETAPKIALAIVIFSYLFIIFKFLKPKIEKYFQREYNDYTERLNSLFSIKSSKQKEDDINFWESLFETSIGSLQDEFNITSAYFFMINKNKEKYDCIYGFGDESTLLDIEPEDEIIESLKHYKKLYDKAILRSDIVLEKFKDNLIQKLTSLDIEVVIPFFDLQENLISLLMLGKRGDNEIYSKTFMNALEVYNIQLERQISNGMVIEDFKEKQIYEHDKIVVSTIKKKIIPSVLQQNDNLRISSFFINNSDLGGDYYDSAKLDKHSSSLFIADTGYNGIESSILALELFTVFNTNLKNLSDPDHLLNSMNWIVSTSKMSSNQASALSIVFTKDKNIVYSSAAYNPLIIFNPSDGSFKNCSTEGIPIGVDPKYKYKNSTIQLNKNDIGIIFSDGLISATTDIGEKYSLQQVQEIVKTYSSESPAHICRYIYKDLIEFIKEKDQTKDICLIIFKV